MTRSFIDIAVLAVLFTTGIAWTVTRYGEKGERFAFAVVAVLSPLIILTSLVRFPFLVMKGSLKVGPCPVGLPEAERMVAEERQRMFGGELREPTLSRDWQRAYQLELQRQVEGVERIAQRVFVHA